MPTSFSIYIWKRETLPPPPMIPLKEENDQLAARLEAPEGSTLDKATTVMEALHTVEALNKSSTFDIEPSCNDSENAVREDWAVKEGHGRYRLRSTFT